MFDFRWLRPSEAEYYQPFDRLKASESRWPRRERHAATPARASRRRGR
jgi:hypothetical protein